MFCKTKGIQKCRKIRWWTGARVGTEAKVAPACSGPEFALESGATSWGRVMAGLGNARPKVAPKYFGSRSGPSSMHRNLILGQSNSIGQSVRSRRHILLLPSSLQTVQINQATKSHIGWCSYRMQGDSVSLKFEGDGHNVSRTKSPTTESVLSEVASLPLLHLRSRV